MRANRAADPPRRRPLRCVWRPGFTLVELLLCLVIVAILAALAVPGYRTLILRTQRVDARAALLRIQADEERHFLQHNRYTSALTLPPAAGGLGLPDVSEHGFYSLQLSLTRAGSGFVATARATGVQSDDLRCATFSIDETGRRDATGTDADPRRNCWR